MVNIAPNDLEISIGERIVSGRGRRRGGRRSRRRGRRRDRRRDNRRDNRRNRIGHRLTVDQFSCIESATFDLMYAIKKNIGH